MTTLNVARSKNPNARAMIKNEAVDMSIIFDLPQEFSITNSSSFTNYNLLSSGLSYLGKVAGGGIMLQPGTKQVWVETQPTSFHMRIQLDAEKSAFDDVHKVATLIHMLTLPYEGGGGFLLPPNSIRGINDNNITSIRIGRQFFFETVVVNSVTENSETRIAADGFPISGSIDVQFTTDFVLSREQWAKIAGNQSEGETYRDLGTFGSNFSR